MSLTLIHIRYDAGRWLVQRDDRDAPDSEHPTATAAERAALAQAAAERQVEVVMHDRYARVRFVRLERPRR